MLNQHYSGLIDLLTQNWFTLLHIHERKTFSRTCFIAVKASGSHHRSILYRFWATYDYISKVFKTFAVGSCFHRQGNSKKSPDCLNH